MDLSLKDIQLPKDPLDTDRGSSGSRSSLASQRERNKSKLAQQKDPNYDIPQNTVELQGVLMFKDQVLDHGVFNLDRPRLDKLEYSPTGNSWNQSDIDSDFHRADPDRYPPRKERIRPKGPYDDSETTSAIEKVSQAPSTFIIDTNAVTSFADLVDKRKKQSISKQSNSLHAGPKKKRSTSRAGQGTSLHSSQGNKVKRKGTKASASRKDSRKSGQQNLVITQKELDEMNKNFRVVETRMPTGQSNLRDKKRSMPPDIAVTLAESDFRKILDTADGHKTLQGLNTLDPVTLAQEIRSAHSKHAPVPPSKSAVPSSLLDPYSSFNVTPIARREAPNTGRHATVSPHLGQKGDDCGNLQGLNRTQRLVKQCSTMQIQGDRKELVDMKRTSRHQESTFSFKPPPATQKASHSQPPGNSVSLAVREDTPQRILREFNEKAKTYKLGLKHAVLQNRPPHLGAKTEAKTEATFGESWRTLMNRWKDEWEFTTQDMYNGAPSVLYDAYLVNLSHTVAAKLSQIAGKNVRVNLRQGKPFKKIQINVTTVHQTKFRLTKFGNGFGYGTTDKLSPEDAFLGKVFEKVNSEALEKRRLREQKETLAKYVPPIVKKAPKPVTDSLAALHLTCRRGVPIDKNGMPFLVEKDSVNRDKYQAYLSKKGVNKGGVHAANQSTKSIRSTSLKTSPKSSSTIQLRMSRPSEFASASAAKLSSGTKSSRQNVYTISPKKSKDFNQSQYWLSKVDSLIGKFDESFRQSEIQQQSIKMAQQELQYAKNRIIEKINQESGDEFDSKGSYNQDSCMDPSDAGDLAARGEEIKRTGQSLGQSDRAADRQEMLSSAQQQAGGPELSQQGDTTKSAEQEAMGRTFQTNAEREEYQRKLDELQDKYNSLESMAQVALQNQWDSRQEILRMAKDSMGEGGAKKPGDSKKSLAASKKSFRRDRDRDNIILNERSGDLMSNTIVDRISPQQLFEHFEKLKLQMEKDQVKNMPSFRSAAERKLKKKLSYVSKQQKSLIELAQQKGSAVQLKLQNQANRHHVQRTATQESTADSNNLNKDLTEQLQIGPTSANPSKDNLQQSPNFGSSSHKQMAFKALSTLPQNMVFDINEAAQKEHEMARANHSIMQQLQQQSTPQARAIKRVLESKKTKAAKLNKINRDIEAFISSPAKKTPVKSPNKSLSKTSSKSPLNTPSQHRQSPIIAISTKASGLKVQHPPQPMPNQSLMKPVLQKGSNSPKAPHQMSATVKHVGGSDSTTQGGHNDHQTAANMSTTQGALSQTQTQNINAMRTTLFASEDDHQKDWSKANIAFKPGGVMQIVDEAEETKSVQRPSFFDQMQMTIRTRPRVQLQGESGVPSPLLGAAQNSQSRKMLATTQSPSKSKLITSPTASSAGTLKLKALKQQQLESLKFPPKKPPVPSFSVPPLNKIVTSQKAMNLTGFKTTRGGNNPIVDLKPITHTNQSKFKPHPDNYNRFRTILPPASNAQQKLQATRGSVQNNQVQPGINLRSSISPYQMMIEEMRKKEQTEGDVARPTIDQLGEEDVNFKGEVTVQGGASGPNGEADLRASFFAFETKLEHLMEKTSTTAFAGLEKESFRGTLASDMHRIGAEQKFINRGRLPKQDGQVPGKPYFKNDAPLKDTYTTRLEKKFLETELRFKQQAEKLIADVRELEEQKREDKASMHRTVSSKINGGHQNGSRFGRTHFATTDNQSSRFGQRHASQHMPQNHLSNTISLKEQLRALKLQEANKSKAGLSGGSAIQSKRRSHQVGVGATLTPRQGSCLEQEAAGDYQSPSAADQIAVVSLNNTPGSSHTQREAVYDQAFASKAMRQTTDMLNASLYSSAGGGAGGFQGSQNGVSYTYKKFKFDSQKEHTRHLLPSVVKMQ